MNENTIEKEEENTVTEKFIDPWTGLTLDQKERLENLNAYKRDGLLSELLEVCRQTFMHEICQEYGYQDAYKRFYEDLRMHLYWLNNYSMLKDLIVDWEKDNTIQDRIWENDFSWFDITSLSAINEIIWDIESFVWV